MTGPYDDECANATQAAGQAGDGAGLDPSVHERAAEVLQDGIAATPVPLSATDATTADQAADVGSSTNLKAIALMCLAVTLFGCLDTTAKYLATEAKVPVMQVIWVRFVAQFLGVIIIFTPQALPRLIRANRVDLQLGRSMLLLGATLFNFLALQYLRLDQTTTMFFLTPLTVALLAGPILGEWVGLRRLVAILVGFAGILVAVRPGLAEVHPAFLLSLCAMLSYAGFSLITRYLAPFDRSDVTFFYSMLAGVLFIAPFAISDWVWPTAWTTWALLASLGVWGGLGHYVFIMSMRQAPASVVAPFVYAGLLANTTLGYVVFGDLPDGWTLVGAAIVIASGLYLFFREQKLRGQV